MFEDLIKEKIKEVMVPDATGCFRDVWKNIKKQETRKITKEQIRKFLEATNGSILKE